MNGATSRAIVAATASPVTRAPGAAVACQDLGGTSSHNALTSRGITVTTRLRDKKPMIRMIYQPKLNADGSRAILGIGLSRSTDKLLAMLKART